MTIATPRRALLLAAGALPIAALHDVEVEPSRLAEKIAIEYFSRAQSLPKLERALRAALDEAGRLQNLVHAAEDTIDMLLEALETTPVHTAADALAKVQVGRALVAEGIDHRRHEFLAEALAELEAFG